MFPGKYTLYGSKRSYFTQKVENILHFQGLPYVLVEKMIHDGSPIETRAGSGAIPVLVTPEDWPLSDSTPIARLLNDRYPESPIIPSNPVQRIGTLIMEDWLDEWFMRVAMYTRWNFEESVEALVGSGVSQAALSKPWHAISKEERLRLMPQVEQNLQRIATFRHRMTTEVALSYGTTPDQGKDIMGWFGQFLDDLADHLQHHSFLLGSRPTVADFMISGGFEAHFGNDLYPRRFVEERQPAIFDYVDRCWTANAGQQQWLPEDQLPETWAPFFHAMQQLYLPYLLKNREALALAQDHVEMDYGFGLVQTPVRIYQELSRMNLRDEIVRLPAPDLARVKSAIPEGVLAAYLAAPLDDVPELTGNKDTFPDPRGIGTLDNV